MTDLIELSLTEQYWILAMLWILCLIVNGFLIVHAFEAFRTERKTLFIVLDEPQVIIDTSNV